MYSRSCTSARKKKITKCGQLVEHSYYVHFENGEFYCDKGMGGKIIKYVKIVKSKSFCLMFNRSANMISKA